MSELTGALDDMAWPAPPAQARDPAMLDTVSRDDAASGISRLRGTIPLRDRLRRARPSGELPQPALWRGAMRGVARLLALLASSCATWGELPPVEIIAPSRSGSVLTPRRLVRGLSRRTRARALRRLSLLPCFGARDYLALHHDVARSTIPPAFHALFIGTSEGRPLFRPVAMARSLGLLAARPAAAHVATLPPLASLVARAPRVGVYVSARGNVFMREIAEDLAASLRAAGVESAVLDETADIAARPPHCVFVAPHEFFVLGQGPAWVRDDVVASAVMLNTEQVQTPWFGRALPFVLASRGVIDLCAQTGALFARTGLPSLHVGVPPSPGAGVLSTADRRHPLFRVLPQAARAVPSTGTRLTDRPIDIAFFGAESPHREAWLARNAAFLAEYETFIHLRRMLRGPILPDSPDGALTRLAQHVCGHARISLNLHRDVFSYLEWHRVVRLGMAGGSVVVSEPCLPHPLLRPGVHYLEENTRQIPELIAWLLRTADGRQLAAAIQCQAAALLATELDGRQVAARVLAFLLDGAG
jgi:hypothetical protein